jgi:hypothetical protein
MIYNLVYTLIPLLQKGIYPSMHDVALTLHSSHLSARQQSPHHTDYIPLPCKYRDGSPSPLSLCSVQAYSTWISCHPPPVYDSTLLSPKHCSSPPPAYTPLSKGEDATLTSSPCSCVQRRKPKRRRLVAVLTVIIMILLSITVGVALKHWELLNDVRGDGVEVGEMVEDKLNINANMSDEYNMIIISTIIDKDDNTSS